MHHNHIVFSAAWTVAGAKRTGGGGSGGMMLCVYVFFFAFRRIKMNVCLRCLVLDVDGCAAHTGVSSNHLPPNTYL